MILISTRHRPATDLGYLLHKNPNRIFARNVTFGSVTVAFTEAREDLATVALLLDIDPVHLVRGRGEAQGSVAQYVNDRPYVASSFLSVALLEAFRSAVQGRCTDRPELAETAIPLEIRIPVLPCRSGKDWLQRLFEPLGYQVAAARIPLDSEFPEWGDGPYFDVTLSGTLLLRDALRHLYLLLPVLDAKKHYYMDVNEVTKLVSKGEGWLAAHPEKDWILRASLGRKPSLMRAAFEQLANAEESLAAEALEADEVAEGEDDMPRVSLHRQRHERIVEIIRRLKPKSVVDLGCGDGKLIRELVKIRGIDRILGMDVAFYEVEKAIRKLNLEDSGPRMRERVEIVHGSLLYRDERLAGFEVCTIVEVIEHLDAPRLAAFEKVVFKHAAPKTILLTTPNREYNPVYQIEGLRHADHRFEWTRDEFQEWAARVAATYEYTVEFEGVGEEHELYGAPSQLAVFTK